MSLASDAPATPAASTAAILEGLNDEQREAVTHGEGPLLIVAGAGTGKTEVITRRIAWLITTKRARPEEILALTFTEKAAAEMETRVDVLVPYGFAATWISTFHAFGDGLVREHAVELGLTSQLRVESPAEILVFVRERLFELPLDRYLPLGRPDQHLQALVSLFDRARDEDVSPARYLEFAEGLAAAAGDDPALRDRAAAEGEKARAYAAYADLLLRHGRVDFGSQIGLALRLLRERPYLAREYRERFRYVLVDEFQDTNHVQFELVKLLVGPRGNLTVVGDDDQSIYRFRGAKIENLLGFLDVYPGARVLVLKKNYRAGQALLDAAHRMIQYNNPDRLEAALGYDKRLSAERGLAGTLEHRVFQTASDEADAVAEDIAADVAAGRRPGDIAVLARAHRHLEPFAAALQVRGVPFRRAGRRGLYARPEVHLCLNVLRTVADPDDGAAAYMALGDPLFGADPVDLARLNAAAARRNLGVLRVAGEAAEDSGAGLADGTREAVRRFLALHRRLCASAVRRPTSEVLYEFVTESGLLGRLAAEESAEAAERVQNLNKLFGIVARVGPLLRHDRVAAFMGHLDLLIEMGDDPAAAEIEPEENAVHLLTAHNAKGLEFPVVHLTSLAERRFPLYGRADALPLPAELRRGGADGPEDHYREERRLCYVAMTRARDRLVLTHAVDYGGKQASKASRFVVEALGLPTPPKGARAATPLESIARYAPTAEPPAPEIAPVPDDQVLRVSHGQIDDYLTCPLKYRYAHVARVPLASDPAIMYGIAIHHAIRVFLQHRMKGLPVGADDVVAAFEEAWSSEGFYSLEHEERRLQEGRETLRRFVARESAGGRVPLAIEREFKFRVGASVVAGRWDRIDERREGIVLVDYKTSDVTEQEQADLRARNSLKEDQLGLYALAYHEMYGVVPARVELHYADSGLTGSAAVGADHLVRARRRVETAAAGIRGARFPADPDQRKCGDCPYSRFCVHSAARGPS